MNKTIRQIDIINKVKQYLNKMFGDNANLVDTAARENIKSLERIVLVFKCYYRID